MSTTRRTVLRGLAASPAALVLPSVALAATTASTSPDAALIAYADRVADLAVRQSAVSERCYVLSDRRDALAPPRPQFDYVPADAPIEVTRDEHGEIVAMRIGQTSPAVREAQKRSEGQHEDAVAEWKAERERIAERIGLKAAERLEARLYRRLEHQVGTLMERAPVTFVGLAAKVRAVIHLDPHDDYTLNEWENAARTTILEDVMRLAGTPRSSSTA